MTARHHSDARGLLAVIVRLNGLTSEKSFSNRRMAIEWFEGVGAASFSGKIERVEPYDGRRRTLVWSRSFV